MRNGSDLLCDVALPDDVTGCIGLILRGPLKYYSVNT